MTELLLVIQSVRILSQLFGLCMYTESVGQEGDRVIASADFFKYFTFLSRSLSRAKEEVCMYMHGGCFFFHGLTVSFE